MTIKELADELGVNKERIKYLYRQLPKHMYLIVEGRVILSDAAVDAVKNRLNGGELTSEIPVPPYNAVNPVGWGLFSSGETGGEISPDSGKNGDLSGDAQPNSGENSKNSSFTGEFTGETRLKSGDGETGDFALTIFDHYKTMIETRDAQLSAKDEQITALHAQIDKLTTALTERDTAAQEASERQINAARADAAEQLTAKDAQLSRMQDTVDALTKQLADAAERERQLREDIESREQSRKWWQWWKR